MFELPVVILIGCIRAILSAQSIGNIVHFPKLLIYISIIILI